MVRVQELQEHDLGSLWIVCREKVSGMRNSILLLWRWIRERRYMHGIKLKVGLACNSRCFCLVSYLLKIFPFGIVAGHALSYSTPLCHFQYHCSEMHWPQCQAMVQYLSLLFFSAGWRLAKLPQSNVCGQTPNSHHIPTKALISYVGIWIRMVLIGLYVWILSPQMVGLFGKDYEVWPGWKRFVIEVSYACGWDRSSQLLLQCHACLPVWRYAPPNDGQWL